MDEESLRDHETVTKVKNVAMIELGRHRMEAWYFSPFPPEYYPDGVTDKLHFCAFCLSFFRFEEELAQATGPSPHSESALRGWRFQLQAGFFLRPVMMIGPVYRYLHKQN